MSLSLRHPTLLDTLIVCTSLAADEREQIRAFTGEGFNHEVLAAEAWGYRGPKLAIVNEKNEALVVGGFIPQRDGVYRSWFFASTQAWERGQEVTQVTADLVRDFLVRDAHRIETLCLASRARALRWYTRVGLHHEATFRKFGTRGEDAALYVAIRPENG